MKHYDVIVVGGGFSGAAAAISAAREGASVLLVEQSNCLGGAATNCLVYPYMGWWTKIDGKDVALCQGVFAEINEELQKFGQEIGDTAFSANRFSDEYLKIVLMQMAQKAGVDFLFRSYLCRAEREGNKVKSITVANKSGMMVLTAEKFIDATGDADLAHLAKFPSQLGREEDNLCQPMTLCFRLSNVDVELFKKEKPLMDPLYKKFKDEGKISNHRETVLTFYTLLEDIVHFNSTRVVKLNPTDAEDITKAEIIAREQTLELYLFMKNNFESCKNSHLLMTAMQIGVRESRMICGEHTLTKDEIMACTKFEDSIAFGNYDIDIHNPEGGGTSHYYFPDGEYYSIPYRSLIPKDAENLLVAGRCISADHDAQASLRIMPIVCCIGQAAGTAAAIAVNDKKPVKEIDVEKLRKALKDNGAMC